MRMRHFLKIVRHMRATLGCVMLVQQQTLNRALLIEISKLLKVTSSVLQGGVNNNTSLVHIQLQFNSVEFTQPVNETAKFKILAKYKRKNNY